MNKYKAGRSYKGELDAINEQRHILDVRTNNLKSEWIKAKHPLKIGEYVTVNDMSAHTGRTMKVFNISVRKENSGEWVWQAMGRILKKYDKVGTQQGAWSRPVVEKEY